MIVRKRSASAITVGLLVLCGSLAIAAPNDPITGARFDSLLAQQQPELQTLLAEMFPESDGYLVRGPLDALLHVSPDIDPLYNSVHVICPDLATLSASVDVLKRDPRFKRIKAFVDKPRRGNVYGYRGVQAEYESPDLTATVQFNTLQQIRWLLWAREQVFAPAQPVDQGDARQYAAAVSDYLYAVDQGLLDAAEPKATDYGLPATADFYAEPPPYVIEGYQAYKDFLHSHVDINTAFARGVVAFLPGDSLRRALITSAPREAFPNKEAPRLQDEYRTFFARGGDWHVMQTLTAVGFDTLQSGEYFFAVGLSGQVRFGHELPREEVKRIESETGRKLPRANHSFLFPGEPVLSAGAFFIKRTPDGRPYIDQVNAQSGHFFYSNVSPTVREDIAERSDHYLLTLGHFFAALERLGVPYDSVLIWKL